MRRIRFFALLLTLCLCLGTASIAHAEEWSEEYYRARDVTEELSEAEEKSLDEDCVNFVSTYHLDLAMLAVTAEYYDGETLAEHAARYYERCGFGYGEGHDGFMMIYDPQTEDLAIVCFGAADGVVPADYLDFVKKSAQEFREEHGIWGVMYATFKHLSNYLDDPSQFAGTPRESASDAPLPARDAAGGMPDWYPADPAHFTFFHDEDAPRVVDCADIFTDEEERRMESRITELRRELERDIVVFTDVSDYGLGHDIYSADFYDFNGYGCGAEREGFCLFVCMDPNNRGFWTVGTGPDSMALQTEETANLLDDALYEYLAAGEYGAGAADWIENIAVLYRKGMPFVPDWYPDRGTAVDRARSADSPRVVDDMGALDGAEADMLASRALALASQYGVDIVIHITPEPVCTSEAEYADVFFRSGGYGFGEDGDAIVATVIRRSNYWICRVVGHGSYAQRLTRTAQSRLEDHTANRISSAGAYGSLSRFLDETEHFLRTGRAPRTTTAWIIVGIFASLVGLIVGGIALAGARRKMKTVSVSRNADDYLLPDSLQVEALRDDFLGTTVSRRYHPRESTSSSSGSRSSGSSHRSSYSSSYRSSSGSSHSGSGRRF